MAINSARKFYWILPVAAFAFSAGSRPKKDLWDILERHIAEEALQAHLAIIVVSEGESVNRRAQAVSKLVEIGAETLVEEVQMALIDAVRLQDTPQKVKLAISRTFKPSIIDEKNQMSILDYALSEKAQGAGQAAEITISAAKILKIKRERPRQAAEITVSAAIEGFRYLSASALLKTMELAAHPQAPKNFCLSAMRTVKREFSKSPENREMQMAIVDLALSDQASQKGKEMIQLLSGAIGNFQNSSPAVLLKLAELAVSPKKVHRPFREPALDVLERSAASIDSETQKKLLAALVSQDITKKMAQKTIGIFHKIPKIDPEAENLLVKAVFFNQKSIVLGKKKRKSRKKEKSPNFYENSGLITAAALIILLPPAAGAAFFYGIADGEANFLSIFGVTSITGLSIPLSVVIGKSVHLLGQKIDQCRAAFKKKRDERGL